ncbi:MAG TPA: molybdenum cofactor guanylyltransferase [Candidatus Nanopelagicaceae bacterium]
MSNGTDWSAIILTGGTSRRFGSNKSEAAFSEHSLLNEILLALPVELPVIVVGPEPMNAARPIILTREEPAFGGPVAGIAAGLAKVESEFVGIIATDMPFFAPMLLQLGKQLSEGFDAVIPVDAAGFRQPLSAGYRVQALRKALLILGIAHGQSMHNLLDLLIVREVLMDSESEKSLMDIDSPSDLENALLIREQMKDNPINERR